MQEQHVIRASWNPWPISVIAFFAVAIIGCGAFIVFCSRHPADLVSADYYEQEIRYQGQVDRQQHAQLAGYTAAVTYDNKTRRISICLAPKVSTASTTGTIQLYRPSATNLDRQVKLAPDEHGVQTIDASSLLPGLWKVRVSWNAQQQEFYFEQKIVIEGRNS